MLVLVLALALFCGGSLARRWMGDAHIAAVAGVSVLLALATPALLLFVLSVIRVEWSSMSLLVTLGLCAAVSALARRSGATATTEIPRAPFGVWAWVLTLFAAVQFSGYWRVATIGPTPEVDFLYIWGLKAKTFWLARGVDWNFLSRPDNAFAHTDYPLLLPLTYDWISIAINRWDPVLLGVTHPLYAAGVILVMLGVSYETLKGWTAALFLICASLGVSLSPYIGLAEAPLIAYGTSGVLLIRRAIVLNHRGSAHVGATLLGLAALSKNEGLTLLLATAVVTVFMSRVHARALLLAFALAASWLITRAVLGVETDLTSAGALARASERLSAPGVYVQMLLRYPLGRPWFWTGMLLLASVTARELWKRERFVLSVILLQACALFSAYLITPHDLDWHFRWSWERVMNQLTPLLLFAVVATALLRSRSVSNEERSSSDIVPATSVKEAL